LKCPFCEAYFQSNFSRCSECGRYIQVEFKRTDKGSIISKPLKKGVKCEKCGAEMQEDTAAKRNYKYIIPYVCKCGHRDSILKPRYLTSSRS